MLAPPKFTAPPVARLLLALVTAATAASISLPRAFSASPDINSVKLGEAAITFSAGSVRRTMPTEGVVSPLNGDAQTATNKMILGAGEICYLQLTKTSRLAAGDYVTLYRRNSEVFHPAKGTYLGDLFTIVGLGLVTEISRNLATVKILRTWNTVSQGDRALLFAEPLPPEPPLPGRSLPVTPGFIVAFPPQYTLVAQAQVVYIDWGREDGLRVGDRLEVLRDSPKVPVRKIGELKVLSVEDKTATTMIVRSAVPFLKGDRFIFKEPPRPQVAESAPPPESVGDELDRLAAAAAQAPLLEAAQPAAGGAEPDLSRLAALARQLEFEQGAASVSPSGIPAMKEISEILRSVSGKQIRIEGHADRIPIGPQMKRQFRDNVALSKARAQSVVQYLVEEGGVDPASLTIVGHGEGKPVASNRTLEGQKLNRRIEIVLVPRAPDASPAPAAEAPVVPDIPPAAESAERPPAADGDERVLPPAGSPATP